MGDYVAYRRLSQILNMWSMVKLLSDENDCISICKKHVFENVLFIIKKSKINKRKKWDFNL